MTMIRKKKVMIKKYNKPDLIYDNKYAFCEYQNTDKFDSLSFKSKYSYLQERYNDLKEFNKLDLKK